MTTADHFVLPEDTPGGDPTDNVAKNMALSMDPYLQEAQVLERKAELLRVLPEHDEEGQLLRRGFLAQAAVFRRAAKDQAQNTWREKA